MFWESEREDFQKILGKKGFGYDPIFIPNNHIKTFGQIFKKYKIKMDHRS